MIRKKLLSLKWKNTLIGSFFVILGLLGSLSVATVNSTPVYAEPEPTETTETTEVEEPPRATMDSCKDSLGALGWLVCPTTGKISEAVDWLYDKIESYLVVSPIPAKNGAPIYEIWKYIKGMTNIAFIVFLLIVIYSQITGLGINNYGIKKALPKLIVAAVLVNLSFLVCQLAVDASNLVGNGLRGIFASVAEAAIPEGVTNHVAFAEMYTAIAGGAALTIGALVIAFETGAIWMLIPMALGALVAVVSGLVTIALRQAVVALLIMISPLAMVANILPNTEQWFRKWKDLFFKMLIFYPMFSLLFGASQLAGFAIIASAKDGFGVLLGTAVQIFPLFFSWSLMKLSGTFLGGINAKLNSLAAGPLARNRAWADSQRQLSKYNHLASRRAMTPSLKLMQFMSNRKIAKDEELSEKQAFVKERGLAYRARQNYRRGDLSGVLSKKGEEAYGRQAETMEYQQQVLRDKNNFNKGFGYRAEKGTTRYSRLDTLDTQNVLASDKLKMEQARGAAIEYANAKGFHERITNAMNAHMDTEAKNAGDKKHQFHYALGDAEQRLQKVLDNKEHIDRYNQMKNIMEGEVNDVHFVGADAAHTFNAHAQIVRGKFKDYFDYTAPTQDVVKMMNELTKSPDSTKQIDPIIAGLRTLNMRGDTDLVRKQIDNILNDKKVELGTYASQSLANFLMFDVKDNDPFLRRFGKYINLETAAMFNEAEPEERRKRKDVSLYEYVNGEYIDVDDKGNMILDATGKPKTRDSKKGAAVLLTGTPFKGIERTAIANMVESIREQSVTVDGSGNKSFDYEKFKKNEEKIWNAIMPNIIGDQFSFLSGSEQIIALGKGLTGVNPGKHRIDWEGIFGDYAKTLTPEQKKDYMQNVLSKRMSDFFGGHVPSQIARSKTDILVAAQEQYTLLNALDDPEAQEMIYSLKPENKKDEDDWKNRINKAYAKMETKYEDGVKEKFVDSFKTDALKGFAKMYRKIGSLNCLIQKDSMSGWF